MSRVEKEKTEGRVRPPVRVNDPSCAVQVYLLPLGGRLPGQKGPKRESGFIQITPTIVGCVDRTHLSLMRGELAHHGGEDVGANARQSEDGYTCQVNTHVVIPLIMRSAVQRLAPTPLTIHRG